MVAYYRELGLHAKAQLWFSEHANEILELLKSDSSLPKDLKTMIDRSWIKVDWCPIEARVLTEKNDPRYLDALMIIDDFDTRFGIPVEIETRFEPKNFLEKIEQIRQYQDLMNDPRNLKKFDLDFCAPYALFVSNNYAPDEVDAELKKSRILVFRPTERSRTPLFSRPKDDSSSVH
jgi:hypothetical protein